MKERFAGPSGRSKVVEALLGHEVVGQDRALAARLATLGRCVDIASGDVLCEQDDETDAVFLIISGTVAVKVNGHRVMMRGKGETIGELAAIDPSARRSATVVASGQVSALRLTAGKFIEAGQGDAGFWRNLAKVVGRKLRERERYHLAPNVTPMIFLGSSVEGLEVAREVDSGLRHEDGVRVVPWFAGGVFGPSQYTMDDLVRHADQADFAAFVFGKDDKLHTRGKRYHVPRDNVVFELGLFLGRLGRDRVVIIKDRNAELKLPSDLAGVNPLQFKCKTGGTLQEAVVPLCTDILGLVRTLGSVANRMTGVTGRAAEQGAAGRAAPKKRGRKP